MKRAPLFSIFFGFLIVFAGCKKPVSDADAIRAGINQHLSGLKTINLSAMDMTVNNFSIQGNQAQAHVEFRPKTGAPQGAGMQVDYTLEKQNGIWTVQKTEPAGGTIQHPAQGDTSRQTMTPGTPGASTALPNFGDLVGAPSGNAMPPGHPQVAPQANSSSQGPSYNSTR